MKIQADHKTRLRLLKVMRDIIEYPYGNTVAQLAQRYTVDKSTIKRDIQVFREAGFEIEVDKKYRYAFQVDKPFKDLENLLQFSEEDQLMLAQALDQVFPHSPRAERLQYKLESIYDFRKLGSPFLRKPYLERVDQLFKAQKEKKRIILEDYRSSHGNEIRDRYIEAFHPSPSDDMLHAFDIEKKELRHFRISRIKRVKLTDEPWQFENHHIILPTDPFRIVDKDQVQVHLRLSVGAYNELVERFPLTKGYIEEAAEEGMFDFQTNVNHQFRGLTNFILGHYHLRIEVLEPESLKTHLRETIDKMKF